MQATNTNFKDVVTRLGPMECLKKKENEKKAN